jgi:hypothetical protein
MINAEKGVHSNIKADRAAIIKRRIHPPHIYLKRDFYCFANFVVFQRSAGPAGKYSGAEDTNSR